jgi:hypothetical protein
MVKRVALKQTTALAKNLVTAEEAESFRLAKASSGEGPTGMSLWPGCTFVRLDGNEGHFGCFPVDDDLAENFPKIDWIACLPGVMWYRALWNDTKLIRGVAVNNRLPLPPRDDLGFMDKTKWPLSLKGRPQDPAKIVRELEIFDGTDDGVRLVFSTTGKWLPNSVLSDLASQYNTAGHDKNLLPLLRFAARKQVIQGKKSYYAEITPLKWVRTTVDPDGIIILPADDEPLRKGKVEVIPPKKSRRDDDDRPARGDKRRDPEDEADFDAENDDE